MWLLAQAHSSGEPNSSEVRLALVSPACPCPQSFRRPSDGPRSHLGALEGRTRLAGANLPPRLPLWAPRMRIKTCWSTSTRGARHRRRPSSTSSQLTSFREAAVATVAAAATDRPANPTGPRRPICEQDKQIESAACLAHSVCGPASLPPSLPPLPPLPPIQATQFRRRGSIGRLPSGADEHDDQLYCSGSRESRQSFHHIDIRVSGPAWMLIIRRPLFAQPPAECDSPSGPADARPPRKQAN